VEGIVDVTRHSRLTISPTAKVGLQVIFAPLVVSVAHHNQDSDWGRKYLHFYPPTEPAVISEASVDNPPLRGMSEMQPIRGFPMAIGGLQQLLL